MIFSDLRIHSHNEELFTESGSDLWCTSTLQPKWKLHLIDDVTESIIEATNRNVINKTAANDNIDNDKNEIDFNGKYDLRENIRRENVLKFDAGNYNDRPHTHTHTRVAAKTIVKRGNWSNGWTASGPRYYCSWNVLVIFFAHKNSCTTYVSTEYVQQVHMVLASVICEPDFRSTFFRSVSVCLCTLYRESVVATLERRKYNRKTATWKQFRNY